jgi:hypothetical protein
MDMRVIEVSEETISGNPVVFGTSLIALAGLADTALETVYDAGQGERGVLIVTHDKMADEYHAYVIYQGETSKCQIKKIGVLGAGE